MKKGLVAFLLGLVVGLCMVPLAVFIYVWFGFAPVATSAPPLPFEAAMAGRALETRIAREAPHGVPIADNEANLMAGATVYRENCAACHGLKGKPQTSLVKGMFPPPPQLFEGKGVTDDTVEATYWKVAHGIRLSGMPAFSGSLSNVALWQVSLLLANAYHLPPAVRQHLNAEPAVQ